MPPRTDKVLAELRAWCTDETGKTIHGRNAEVAAFVGTTRQAVHNWFVGARQPTAEQILAVQEFLEKQRRRR